VASHSPNKLHSALLRDGSAVCYAGRYRRWVPLAPFRFEHLDFQLPLAGKRGHRDTKLPWWGDFSARQTRAHLSPFGRKEVRRGEMSEDYALGRANEHVAVPDVTSRALRRKPQTCVEDS
jgi:hypothetical protein